MPDEDAFKVLKAALAEGVNLWGGADFYGTPSSNSLHLLARYFAKYPEDADKVVVCIKSGVLDMRTFKIDGSPDMVRTLVASANKILGPHKKIDVFGIARVDPEVPIEDTVRALAELRDAGEIGGIQLSEVGSASIRRAAAVAKKIEFVEDEVSLWATDIFDNGVAATCAELGIPVVAHTPLGAGMLTGRIRTLDDLPAPYLKFFPRFQPASFQKNLDLVDELEKLARARGVTPAQLALGWLAYKGCGKHGAPLIIALSGARSPERIKENAHPVELREEDLVAIQSILDSFPVLGQRYPEAGMKIVEF